LAWAFAGAGFATAVLVCADTPGCAAAAIMATNTVAAVIILRVMIHLFVSG
jgi:hypothetical protein